MSESNTSHLPGTLEEALAEIDDLRSQLSGSDLKVFSQNRELRVQNGELKAQISSLTEQCVSQSFSIRSLEKSEAKLQEELGSSQSQAAGLQERVNSLEGEVSELKEQVTDLGGQVEVHRSRELDLSKELEQTVAQNSEAMDKLLAEQEAESKARQEEMDDTRRRFEDEVKAKESAIKALEDRVEQFKEEFLSQEFAPVVAAAEGSADGQAFAILSAKMEAFLGFPGKALVEQVFRLSGVDQGSSDPGELEETFEVLQDTASQLVKTPEQEKELAGILESVWAEIGAGSSSKSPASAEEAAPVVAEEPPVVEEPANEEPEAVEEEAPAEPEPTPEPELEAEVEAEPSAEAPAVAEEPIEREESEAEPVAEEEATPAEEPEAAPEEPAPAPSEDEETPQAEDLSEEAPVEEAPATEEAPVPEEIAEAPVEEAPPEDSQEPEAEAATEPEAETEEPSSELEAPPVVEPEAEELPEESAEAAPEPEVAEVVEIEDIPDIPELPELEVSSEEPEEVSVEAEPASEEEALSFDSAAVLLEDGKHEQALPMFEALHQTDPAESTYQVGRLACLAGIGRFQEAYDIGKALEGHELGEGTALYNESMDTALMGLSSEAESDLVRKEYILELLLRLSSPDQAQAFLDEADEIALRIKREGELSLIQAKHRIEQDDVTEYLIDALHSLSDRNEVFQLLRTNLERYPELTPLSEFLERLLQTSRAEALEAEGGVSDLLGQGESIEEQLDETDPGEEAVVQVFLEHLIPRADVEFDIPSEEFDELMLDAEPAAFVGSLRQALRSVDYTVFFDEIEVLSYDGDDHFLLRSSPEPTPTLLFGAELDDVPPEELRFLVLRELFSMYRRHSQLAHISAGLDDFRRAKLVKACLDIFSEFESKVPQEVLDRLEALTETAQEGGQDQDFRSQLEVFLREVYIQTESDSFIELGDFLYGGQLNKKWLDSIADGFAARQTGIVVASYAIARDLMEEDDFAQVEEEGFGWLYSEDNLEKYSELRLRLQRLWTTPLKALISDPEE